MAERTPVQCADCGQVYSARLVEGDVVVATNEGHCQCGSDDFVEIDDISGLGEPATD